MDSIRFPVSPPFRAFWIGTCRRPTCALLRWSSTKVASAAGCDEGNGQCGKLIALAELDFGTLVGPCQLHSSPEPLSSFYPRGGPITTCNAMAMTVFIGFCNSVVTQRVEYVFPSSCRPPHSLMGKLGALMMRQDGVALNV